MPAVSESNPWLQLIDPFRRGLSYLHFGNPTFNQPAIPGATKDSFLQSLADLEGYIGTGEDGQRVLEGLRAEQLRLSMPRDHKPDQAQRSQRQECSELLRDAYQSLLSNGPYSAEQRFHREGGTFLKTYFGSVAAGTSPRATSADIVFAPFVLPSTREYSEDALPLPVPFARFARVNGEQQPFEHGAIVKLDGMEIEREGSYRIWVRLENGLSFRLSAVHEFNEELKHSDEGFQRPLAIWNAYRAIVMRKTIQATQALNGMLAADSKSTAEESSDPKKVMALLFDLAHLTASVDARNPLHKGFCHSMSPYHFEDLHYKAIETFRGLTHALEEKWRSAAWRAGHTAYEQIMPADFGGRYYLHAFAPPSKPKEAGRLSPTSTTIEKMLVSIHVMMSIPDLSFPDMGIESGERMQLLPDMLDTIPDPLSEYGSSTFDSTLEWNPCSYTNPAYANNIAATGMASALAAIK